MLRLLFVSLSTLLLVACSAKPALDYDTTFDFSQIQSYAFAPLESEEGEPVASLDDKRIEQAVSSALQTKGMNATEQSEAQLWVYYRIDEAAVLESQGGSFGVGYSRNRWGVGMSTPVNYKERRYGKVAVVLVNPESKAMVWQGISQNQLRETMSSEKRAEFINKEVARMFETFPPQ